MLRVLHTASVKKLLVAAKSTEQYRTGATPLVWWYMMCPLQPDDGRHHGKLPSMLRTLPASSLEWLSGGGLLCV
jgi:hypothetical protein